MMKVQSYGRMELAQIYFPHICGRAAWRKLKECMADEPALCPLLRVKRRTFLPIEVESIFRVFGCRSLVLGNRSLVFYFPSNLG